MFNMTEREITKDYPIPILPVHYFSHLVLTLDRHPGCHLRILGIGCGGLKLLILIYFTPKPPLNCESCLGEVLRKRMLRQTFGGVTASVADRNDMEPFELTQHSPVEIAQAVLR